MKITSNSNSNTFSLRCFNYEIDEFSIRVYWTVTRMTWTFWIFICCCVLFSHNIQLIPMFLFSNVLISKAIIFYDKILCFLIRKLEKIKQNNSTSHDIVLMMFEREKKVCVYLSNAVYSIGIFVTILIWKYKHFWNIENRPNYSSA